MINYADTFKSSALRKLEQILGSENEDGKFNYICPMTTENISGYFKHVNNFSTVLTVAGSGDQLFNCIYHGAKKVTVFDANPITYFLIRLKMAMFTKSRSEYIEFFTLDEPYWDTHSPAFFAETTYLSIRDLLLPGVQEFWDTYYKWRKDNDVTPQESSLFRRARYSRNTIIEVNDYLRSEEAYRQVRDSFSSVDIQYLNSSITDLPSTLVYEQYNTILLSNLSDYISDIFSVEDNMALDVYETFVNYLCNMYLTLGGQIFFAYIYEATTGPGWTPIDDISELPKHFTNYQLKTIPAMCRERTGDYSTVDAVLYKENNYGI